MCLFVSGVVAWLTRRARGLPTSNISQGRRHRRTLRREESRRRGGAPSPAAVADPGSRGMRPPRLPRHPSRVRHAHRRSETRSPRPRDCGRRHARALRARAGTLGQDQQTRRARQPHGTTSSLAPSSAGAERRSTPNPRIPLARRDPTPSPTPPTDRLTVPAAPPATRSPKTTADSSCASTKSNAWSVAFARRSRLTDAGERDAWTAQLVFLEEDVASAVERVTGAAEPAAGPAPSLDSPNPTVPVAPGRIFAGLDVSPANATPNPSPRCAASPMDLFSGLDLTPSTPTVSAPTDAGAGIDVAPPPPMSSTPSGVAGLGALDESMFASSAASDKTLPPPTGLRRALDANRDRRCASGTLATRTTSTSFRASERATRRERARRGSSTMRARRRPKTWSNRRRAEAANGAETRASESRLRVCRPKRPTSAARGVLRATAWRPTSQRPWRPTSHRPWRPTSPRPRRPTSQGVRRATARGGRPPVASDEPPPVASDEPPPVASDEPPPVASDEPPPVASDEPRARGVRRATARGGPTSHRPWRPTSHRPRLPLLNPRPPHQWTPRWRRASRGERPSLAVARTVASHSSAAAATEARLEALCRLRISTCRCTIPL